MKIQDFVAYIRLAPVGLHTLCPPASSSELEITASKYGAMPQHIIDLWSSHNGIEFCIQAIPLFWFFPLDNSSDDQWGATQSIAEYTRVWRQSAGSSCDWVIGTWNDGRILVMSGGMVSEWDSAEGRATGGSTPLEDWLENLIKQGIMYMSN